MADKAISELVAAQNVTQTDLFVLEQNGTAKKLTGQILENWLVSFADGHGGIQSYELLKTVGLVKTFRFTLADQTYMDIDVVDGRGIKSLKPTVTNGLEVTYTVTYNDDTTDTFTITNGAKGDKGDTVNVWFKYASQEPTAESHSFGDVPDAWVGISSGHLTEAPTDWQQYTWYQWKGEKGDTGEPATLVSSEITYQTGDSGTIIPSGTWSSSVPVVAQGKYLWTRETTQFNTGNPIIKYSVSRFGIDGTGAVSTVAGVSPDSNGNVPLDAASVKALALSGGIMEGPINMNGQTLSGLNAPTKDDEAANMGFVNEANTEAVNFARMVGAPYNAVHNGYFINPVNQRGEASYTGSVYGIDRWRCTGESSVLEVGDGFVKFTNTNASNMFRQDMDNVSRIAGKKVTFAMMVESVDNSTPFAYIRADRASGDNVNASGEAISNNGVSICTIEIPSDVTSVYYGICIANASGASCKCYWAALYEGEYTSDNLPAYQPKGYGVEVVNCNGGAMSMELVWENAQPDSSFPNQSVATADIGQNFVVIQYKMNTTSTTYAITPFIDTNDAAHPLDYITNAGKIQRRRAYVTPTQVRFSTGQLEGSDDNSLMIPIRIYAIKGVIQ